MKVFILVTYNGIDNIFGSNAVFRTIRKGFPNSELYIYNNRSAAVCCADERLPSGMLELPRRIRHDEFIKMIVESHSGPLCFVDTDMIFYDEVEGEFTDKLLQGRWVPPYYNQVVEANESERFHTSLLYIHDAGKVRKFIAEVTQRENYPFNAFAPFVFKLNGKSCFYDTCANLYHTLPKDQLGAFDDNMLDRYTHLVSGSMLNHVSSRIKHGFLLKEIHALAKRNPDAVKGLWREHDKFYADNPIRD